MSLDPEGSFGESAQQRPAKCKWQTLPEGVPAFAAVRFDLAAPVGSPSNHPGWNGKITGTSPIATARTMATSGIPIRVKSQNL